MYNVDNNIIFLFGEVFGDIVLIFDVIFVGALSNVLIIFNVFIDIILIYIWGYYLVYYTASYSVLIGVGVPVGASIVCVV